MSRESVLALIKAAEADQSLKAQLESAEGSEQVLEIAASQGYNFTEEELLTVMQEQQLEFATPPVELSEHAKALMKEVEANETLRQQFESAGSLADMVKIAIDQGYQVTEEEVEAGLTYFEQEGELSDAELEAVAGAGKNNARYKGKSCSKRKK
ncbi:Nif11-like leader peptide family RiPP precursor [Moorena sp. SIO3B2]|uniref:Nif11-like leader peptide family RiPP precursor n=1 Tax=Moorena sp. SIO3B2 TaxID=2607827 RepID=UPI0013C5C563|nr:Nif11-like leader peptide family RiPP precursor [Moorena sp. SIO3B2]NEP34045.1 Nif11-like leader peptide family natural product precursor [Moorena sp. SIO3B2]